VRETKLGVFLITPVGINPLLSKMVLNEESRCGYVSKRNLSIRKLIAFKLKNVELETKQKKELF